MSENYKDVAKKLEENLQELINHGNNEQILQMNLLIRMLTIKQEFRPCAQKVLLHPLFWGEKKCLEFILNIRKKFDILDPKFASKIKNQHQTVLQDTPIVQKLKVALDLNKSVFHNDWKAKLDLSLAEEFKAGYDKESMSDLLRAIRNKVLLIFNLFISLIIGSF